MLTAVIDIQLNKWEMRVCWIVTVKLLELHQHFWCLPFS